MQIPHDNLFQTYLVYPLKVTRPYGTDHKMQIKIQHSKLLELNLALPIHVS